MSDHTADYTAKQQELFEADAVRSLLDQLLADSRLYRRNIGVTYEKGCQEATAVLSAWVLCESLGLDVSHLCVLNGTRVERTPAAQSE
jgi:hypothetical protein